MPSTIRDLTELTTVAVDDYILISDTSDVTNRDKRISKANLVGANITGGGTIALGGFTFTVPASGTPSLLGTAQAFTALKTFSAGINLGQATNLTYLDMGVWPAAPTIQATSSNPTVTYTTQDSFFMRLNTVVFYSFTIVINTISGGTGNLRIGPFPFTSSALNQPRAAAVIDGVAFPGTAPFITAFNVLSNSTLGQIIVIQNNASFAQLPIGNFGAGDSVQASGFYYV
jgi:hypothetical protein